MMVLPGRTRPQTRGGQFGGWLSATARPGSTPFFVLTRKTDPKTGGSELGAWLAAAAALAAIVVVVAAVRLPGAKFGQLLVLGAVALVLGVMVLRSAPFATIILIIAIGLRPATPHVLPIDTFWIVFAGVVGALVLWMDRNPDRPRGMDAIEWAIALYMTWNVYSMISPHEYIAAGRLRRVPRRIVDQRASGGLAVDCRSDAAPISAVQGGALTRSTAQR